MTSAEKYVAGAYLAVFVVVLVYLVIIGLKVSRLQRELADLALLARRRREPVETPHAQEAAEIG